MACKCSISKAATGTGKPTGTINALMTKMSDPTPSNKNKITVIGAGRVGTSCAVCILTKGLTKNLVIVDPNKDLVTAEMLDFNDGSPFNNDARVLGTSDMAEIKDSAVVVITCGSARIPPETRLDLIKKNAVIIKKIVPDIVKYAPDCKIVVVSNPVDVLTYLIWKIGGFPKHRVIGSGTTLDSSRFNYYIGEKLGTTPAACHGYVLGEHGDSSVPVWSNLNISGVKLTDVNPDAGKENDKENWSEVHKKVVTSGPTLIGLKGFTNWGVSMITTAIVEAIIKNKEQVFCVSIYAKGYADCPDEVFTSIPALIGHNGVISIVKQKLTDDEKEKFLNSAKILKGVIDEVPV